jgi:glycosyltransferase Alg8
MILTLYVLGLVALVVHAPSVLWQPGAREFIVLLGVFGAWRYSWQAVHVARALIFRHLVFPRWRAVADRLGDQGRVDQVYIVIMSFRVRAETSARVFQAAIAEAARYGGPVTLVAGLVEEADQRLIKRVFQNLAPPDDVRLVFVRRPASGKRHGLACALRAVSRLLPAHDAAVVLMDGDTLLTPGTLERSLPFLRSMPEIGGITTDEDCLVAGGPLMTAWHRLRFAQRHQLMSSMALSRRLMAMTGRMSIFRARLATDPSFIDMIENDHLEHWRLGSVPLLTGEDKSTWFWLLRAGHDMLYLPDVQVITIEHPPSRHFLKASTLLMLRWFGNMLRTSGRAIALGPRRVGPFAWWCLIDQRLSMWTPLVGPTVALFFILAKSAWFIYAYLLWVGTTRLIQSLLLLTARPRISGTYPFLIYYGQVYGALVKTYILFRLDRQRWTRQNISTARRLPRRQLRWQAVTSAYLHGLALAALVTVVAYATSILDLPSPSALRGAF